MVSSGCCQSSSSDSSSTLPCSQAPKGQDCCCCSRCGVGGCDVKVLADCGHCLHSRCAPVTENHPLTHCPVCRLPARGLFLIPMSFVEIDEAKAAAAITAPSDKRGKKRKNATIARLNPQISSSSSNTEEGGESSDLRTGRWTTQETAYCDKLIEKFESGQLPIVDGIKLNDFLSAMLKSKQSRLTKKMKNARLSARSYKRSIGYIHNTEEAREFSALESAFFSSISCSMERSEIRFHMQKEWRELFSSYCVQVGQKLDADAWLCSVEEMDRRASQAKDAARMARRKIMMGYAISHDSRNPDPGVIIENVAVSDKVDDGVAAISVSNAPGSALANGSAALRDKRQRTGPLGMTTQRPIRSYPSPFVGKVVQYMQRHSVPFEHVDAWVPSFVPSPGAPEQGNAANTEQKCRLCFAGCASTDTHILPDGQTIAPLSGEDQFDLLSFGEYSQKFSFDVGCGLPGRVYSSGMATWEQGVQNAPSGHFERCGGALQWGIKTVLALPVPSPNVGRVVVLFYSRHDRNRDQDLVNRVTDELTKLMPSPKWKLVVDVGAAPPPPRCDSRSSASSVVDDRPRELLSLIEAHMPSDKTSPLAPYLPGFTSLKLLLLKQSLSPREDELLRTLLDSYSSYVRANRSPPDVAWMVSRDYMMLSQQANSQQRMLAQAEPQAKVSAINNNPANSLHQLVHSTVGPQLQQQLTAVHGRHDEQQLRAHAEVQAAFQQLASSNPNLHLTTDESDLASQLGLGPR